MTGTRKGGLITVSKMKARDPDHYRKIGAKGGKASGPEYQRGGSKASGFAKSPEMARIAGAKGGSISRRGKSKQVKVDVGMGEHYDRVAADMAMQPNPAML